MVQSERMIEVRQATADEMILTFLRAEIDSRWNDRYSSALARIGKARAQLIDCADTNDAQQNEDRRNILGIVRGYGRNQYLFESFPDHHTDWRLFTVTPADVSRFKYMNFPNWRELASTRLVADGVNNLNREQGGEIHASIAGIAARLRKGEGFSPLIAVQCPGNVDVVLIDGHHRATAYAWIGSPNEVEVFIGRSASMDRWKWF